MTLDKYTPRTDADELNPDYLFATTANDLLLAIIEGKIDAKELAEKTLRQRGFDNKGKQNWKA